ncbi:MAG: hypothetical protein QM783_03065 [Phycisphaerales bacterium]
MNALEHADSGETIKCTYEACVQCRAGSFDRDHAPGLSFDRVKETALQVREVHGREVMAQDLRR